MPRKLSAIAPDWWDYTTLDADLIDEVSRLTPRDLIRLSRPGFAVVMYDTLEEFYLAEALEYVHAWRQSTDDNPVGICGPIGPTEQLPLVARIVHALAFVVLAMRPSRSRRPPQVTVSRGGTGLICTRASSCRPGSGSGWSACAAMRCVRP